MKNERGNGFSTNELYPLNKNGLRKDYQEKYTDFIESQGEDSWEKTLDLLHRKELIHPSVISSEKQIEITNNCPNKGKVSVSYYSNIQKESKNCNLTGMCYDDDMLKPIYDFLELRNFDTTNFEDLLNSCFDAMRKTLKDEEEYMYTDEYISEEIISNDYEFTENGNIF